MLSKDHKFHVRGTNKTSHLFEFAEFLATEILDL